MPKRFSLQILTVLLAVLSAPLAIAADVPLGQTDASLLGYAPQNNPANAEDTASASEELNAHADTPKETVVDLISLIDSDAHAQRRSGSHVPATHEYAPPPKDNRHAALTMGKGHGGAQGNAKPGGHFL